MGYNDELYSIYESKWDQLKQSVENLSAEVRPTQPLLLKLPDETAYYEADIKVMFVGKETNDWGTFGKLDVQGLQNLYERFLMKDYHKHKNYPFWKYIIDWTSRIEEAFPDSTVSTVWNNIHKLGRKGEIGKPNPQTQELTKKYFNIFEDELEILKPDIVIFLTGPYDDSAIQTYVPGTEWYEIAGYNKNKFARLDHPSLPYISIRTYHPGYLNRLKPEEYEFNRETPIETIMNLWANRLS